MPLGAGKSKSGAYKVFAGNSSAGQKRHSFPGKNNLPNCRSRLTGAGVYSAERGILSGVTRARRDMQSVIGAQIVR